MDHADPQIKGVSGAADGHLLPIDEDLASIRIVDAGEHVHQRSFSTAVFTQERQDLPLINIEVHVLVGNDSAEFLRNIPQLDCSGFGIQ